MTQNINRFVFAVLVCVFSAYHSVLLASGQYALQDLRLSDKRDTIRLVFDFNGPVRHSIFTLSKPERVVLDLENVELKAALPAKRFKNMNILRRIRSAARNGNDLRIVMDLKHRARPKSFPLKPDGQYGHRLVVDLYDSRINGSEKVVKTVPKSEKLRDVIVAIDAGHGGKDPGALGSKGTREKAVTLAIAKRLAKSIEHQDGMKAVLIRDGDYYIGLRDRMIKARNFKADMFISIHADAFKNINASGSSVYALSLSGATSEAAKWLADKENAVDLIGGVSLDDKDDLVASVLLDLSQTATIQSSLEVGHYVLSELGHVKRIHKTKVQQAPFLVLKSPDIPSILIETAFLTNPKEERNLKSTQHQIKIVNAITKGIIKYFTHKAPPGTLLASL